MPLRLINVNSGGGNAGTTASVAGASLFNKAMDKATASVKGVVDSENKIFANDSAEQARGLSTEINNFDSVEKFKAAEPSLRKRLEDPNLTEADATKISALLDAGTKSIRTKNNASFQQGQTEFTQKQQGSKNAVETLQNASNLADAQTQEQFDNYSGQIAGAKSDKDIDKIVADATASNLPKARITALTNASTKRKAANLSKSLTDVEAAKIFENRGDVLAVRQLTSNPKYQITDADVGSDVIFKIQGLKSQIDGNKKILNKNASFQASLKEMGVTQEKLFAAVEESLIADGATDVTKAMIYQEAADLGVPLSSEDVIKQSGTRDVLTGMDKVKTIRAQDVAAAKAFELKVRQNPAFLKTQIDALVPQNSNIFSLDDRERATSAVRSLMETYSPTELPFHEIANMMAQFGHTGGVMTAGQFNTNDFIKIANQRANILALENALPTATDPGDSQRLADALKGSKQTYNTLISGKGAVPGQAIQKISLP